MALTFEDGVHIKTVESFIRYTVRGDLDPGMRSFYRGVGQHFQQTNPSVFRTDARRNNEKALYDQLLAMHPSEFASDATTLDRLVRMQHHGLPTRLLDITSNPLIALYFAIEKDKDEEGEVQVFEVHDSNVKFPDSDRASVVANLARLTTEQHNGIAGIPQHTLLSEFNGHEPVRKLLHFIRQEKPYFEPEIRQSHISTIMVVRGKQSNSRIVAQSGAFLLFGDDANFAKDPKGEGIHKRTMKIPADAKPIVLRQLDRININESTVYPSLDHSASYVSNRFAV